MSSERASLAHLPSIGEGPLDKRIGDFVAMRLRLHDAVEAAYRACGGTVTSISDVAQLIPEEEADVEPLPMPLQLVLAGMILGALGTDRGGREGVSMNGAGNIAGLINEVVPAAQVVHQMAAEAAELLGGAGRYLR